MLKVNNNKKNIGNVVQSNNDKNQCQLILFQVLYGHFSNIPTNTPARFHVETTLKRSFPRRFNVESTWCVCRDIQLIIPVLLLHASSLT